MRISIRPGARTVRCGMCGGGGDVFDGETVETCSICGGSGRHAPDATYGVIDADGGRLIHDGQAEQDSTRGLAVLAALNGGFNKHVYAGTVPAAEVRRRRSANKVARRSRRANRRSAR